MQNINERHRMDKKCNGYLVKYPENKDLNEIELQRNVDDDGTELKKIVNGIPTFSVNIVGSNFYIYSKRRKLEALMDQS